MSNVPATQSKAVAPAQLEKLLLGGDLEVLQPDQRIAYYKEVCDSVGLNWLTKPFDYLKLNGKLVLYANKNGAEQLRQIHSVSITKLEKERIDDVFVVTAYAKNASGREDSSTGAVTVGNLKGDALANVFMKAETKAKRRVTLSICGLGMLDESEIDSIKDAKRLSHQEVDALPAKPAPAEKKEEPKAEAKTEQAAKPASPFEREAKPAAAPPINQNLNDPWDYRLPVDWQNGGGEQLRFLGAERVSKLLAGLKKLKKPNDRDKEIMFYANAALKTPLTVEVPEGMNLEANWEDRTAADEAKAFDALGGSR